MSLEENRAHFTLLAIPLLICCSGSGSGSGSGKDTDGGTTSSSTVTDGMANDGGWLAPDSVVPEGGAAEVRQSEPVVVASGQAYPTLLRASESYIYWLDSGTLSNPSGMHDVYNGNGAIRRALLVGGAVEDVLLLPHDQAIGFDIQGTNLYWSFVEWSGEWPGTTGVRRMPIAGGNVTDVLTTSLYPEAVLASGSMIYVTTSSGLSGADASGTVQDLLGGASAWPRSLLADDQFVYFTDILAGAVDKVPITGGSIQVLASNQAFSSAPLSNLATDGNALYWTVVGSVMTIPKSGGTARALATTEKEAGAIAVDNQSIFWSAEGSAGAIIEVPIGGGTPTTRATGQFGVESLAVSAGKLYWTSGFKVLSLDK